MLSKITHPGDIMPLFFGSVQKSNKKNNNKKNKGGEMVGIL